MVDIDSIESYNYDLPPHRIAEYPLADRAASKLLVYKNNEIIDSSFKNIGDYLPDNALLVFNNTRVVQARFLFQTATGATIEIFSLEPVEGEGGPAESMSAVGKVRWKCFVGNAKRWKQDVLVRTVQLGSGATLSLYAKQLEQRDDYYIIELSWNSDTITLSEIFSLLGDLPLPPYMKRKTEESDKVRYQTVYAKHEGSVAAPTAGLHFTEKILDQLSARGIQQEEVTLHVGAGTFKPVKTASIVDHQMHAEYISVSRSFLARLIEQPERIVIPVGTTSMRTLESIYWLGCKLFHNPSVFGAGIPELTQWDAYRIAPVSVKDSIQALLAYTDSNKKEQFSAKTSLLIKPGYTFAMCKAIITNFHQPKSTLLCLVSSFVGIENMNRIYVFALENDYRFLSYGDSSLLFKTEPLSNRAINIS
ncbi:MAG: S-adenosylmethionine:tRNA ribosyltransferase-isomerase [Cytophaga sp.]|uniref:S-adenosylmethionine:tRNA ribosyltransferase-isomerase n=1 Tax=Cytophaga sp. TaxID=29535 RepID=UPI003F7CE5D3